MDNMGIFRCGIFRWQYICGTLYILIYSGIIPVWDGRQSMQSDLRINPLHAPVSHTLTHIMHMYCDIGMHEDLCIKGCECMDGRGDRLAGCQNVKCPRPTACTDSEAIHTSLCPEFHRCGVPRDHSRTRPPAMPHTRSRPHSPDEQVMELIRKIVELERAYPRDAFSISRYEDQISLILKAETLRLGKQNFMAIWHGVS